MSQFLSCISGPSLVSLEYVRASPVLDPVLLQNWTRHYRCVSPMLSRASIDLPSNDLPNEAQEAVGFLCHKGTMLDLVQLGIYQDPQVLFYKAALQSVDPQPVLVWGALVLPRYY